MENEIPWTQFYDMHSGGGQKLDWPHIFIQAPEDEARVIFYNRFGRSPNRVTCTCCGPDYSISETSTLELATAYERRLRYVLKFDSEGMFLEGKYLEPDEDVPDGFKLGAQLSFGSGSNGKTLKEYIRKANVKIIYHEEILQEERKGEVPQQGFVWVE
jgi:hypothetical protein